MKKRIVLFACILIGGVSTAFGQAEMAAKDSAEKAMQKDLIDVYDHVFHKTGDTARKEGKFRNAPFPAAGYTQVTGFAAVLSDRLDFYMGDSKTTNETDVLNSITYSQYNQIIVQSFSSFWTKGNKYNILTDWRYMKYPSTTFGLGGHTQYSDGYTIDFSYLKLHTTILRRITDHFYAGVGYYFDYFWNIREVDPPSGIVTSFERYGLTSTETGSGPVVRLLYDSRVNPVNPSNGWYASVTYHPSFKFMGSMGDWRTMQIDLRKYIKLRPDGKNILALWNFEWLSVGGKTPYLLLPSTGWDDQFNTSQSELQSR